MNKRIHDPTREELETVLAAFPFIQEADEFAREQAIYWFAANYHEGQWSNLYSVLSASAYNPGRCESGPESDSMAGLLYGLLERSFTT